MNAEATTTTTAATDGVNQGFFTSLKNTLSPSALMERFNITSAVLLEAGICLSVGFLIGFLLKKYGKVIFLVVLLLTLILVAQQLGFVSITFSWDTIQQFFGITTPAAPADTMLVGGLWDWTKGHLLAVLCGLGGFLCGLRLG